MAEGAPIKRYAHILQFNTAPGPVSWCGALIVIALAGLVVPEAAGQWPGFFRKTRTSASWGRTAPQEATGSIPMEKFDAKDRAKVSSVLSKLSICRRLPPRIIPCDPELFLFLADHPDVVVGTWQVLGLSEMNLQQLGPNSYRLTDQSGTDAVAEFLYRDHDTHVAYVEGVCGGPLFIKPAHGSAIMVMKSGYVREPDGRYYVTTRLDAFVRLDNGGLELLTKAFQPVIGKVVDNNFTQTIGFVGCLCRTAEVNPNGVKRLATKLNMVQAPVRVQFAELAKRAAEKAEEAGHGAATTATKHVTKVTR